MLGCLDSSCQTWQPCQTEAFTRAQHMRLTDALHKLFLDFHVESEVPVMLGCLDSSCEKLQRCQSAARSLVHSTFDSQMPCPC